MPSAAARIARWFGAPWSGRGRGRGDRIGVVDIGSNSVRLVVWDGSERAPEVFHNEKALCGLGSELSATGRLSVDGSARALAALRRFAALAERFDIGPFAAVATAAVREAEDGPDFAARASAILGTEIQVAAGEEEARLAAQGVLFGEPTTRGTVADIGGASLELAAVDGAAETPVGACVSTPLGSLRMTRDAVSSAEIDRVLRAAAEPFARGAALHLVGGSWRAAFKVHMRRTGYPLNVLHGFRLDPSEAAEAMRWVAARTPEEIVEVAGVSERRAEVTPAAARALDRLIAALRPSDVRLSAFGLREGALWELMPAERRAEDPLIAACRAVERREARSPGYGDQLADWLAPALALAPEEERLCRAACLLADAVWRTHPDYRARASFELVTRNNFGGVDHAGRLFIGAALLHRQKGGRRAIKDEPAFALQSDDVLARAQAVGRGARLASKLSGAALDLLPMTRLERIDGRLRLSLADARPFVGEEIEKRLRALARTLELEPDLATEPGD